MQFTRRKFIRQASSGITLSEEAFRIHREALLIDEHNDMPGNILDRNFLRVLSEAENT